MKPTQPILAVTDFSPLARHAAERVRTLAVCGRELAGGLQIIGRIGRCCDDRVRRQDGVVDELGREGLLLGRGLGDEEDEERGRSQKGFGHGVTLLEGRKRRCP